MMSSLLKDTNYLLVIVFLENKEHLSLIEIIRGLTKVPLLILSQEYDSIEKKTAIKTGADEYIALSENYLEELLASGRALIRRYTELNQTKMQSPNILLRGALIMSADYRRVFVNDQELLLPRREFDLLYFLASNPRRVFTKEQLYSEVWGEDPYIDL